MDRASPSGPDLAEATGVSQATGVVGSGVPSGSPASDERLLIALLTAVNFTQMMDFVVMMPLGPQLMKVFAISATQFAVAVSAYTISAAVAAVGAALVIDRFERKQALLVVYAAFIVATLACAIAPDFHALVLARVAAGACGGLLGALVLAIVGDAVPWERRGAAMGTVMSAFALASIIGIPAGIWLAAWLGWHATFYAIAAISLAVLIVGWLRMPTMRGHQADGQRNPLATLRALLGVPSHWRVFAFTAALTFSGFMIIPFIATYLSCNVGVSDRELGLVYLCGGVCAVVTSPWIGRLADRHGKRLVFTCVAALAMAPTLALTHLPAMPLAAALVVTTAFIVVGSGRFVPATALMTAAVAAPLRGSFMSFNSAVQSAASGAAAMIAGLIISQVDPTAPLIGYGAVGWLSCLAAVAGILLVWTIAPQAQAHSTVPITRDGPASP
ncbi:MFS transporter [Planctomycetota bacterium]|nr:MFS transporter [Planctomycetota bacterium]